MKNIKFIVGWMIAILLLPIAIVPRIFLGISLIIEAVLDPVCAWTWRMRKNQ